MPNFPKKQQQCLIPKYLLDYATDLQENHPDPSAEWGGGSGGSPIEAGTGIVITGDDTKTISVDTEDVAMVSSLSGVAFSGDYDDLSNKPTNLVTTDGNEIITGGKTFELPITVKDDPMTADQAQYKYDSINYTNLSYNIKIQPNPNSSGTLVIDLPEDSGTLATTGDIPTDVSDLNNDAGYITGITSGDVTTALGYTPYDGSTNPNGYITSLDLNGYATEYWVGQQGYLTSVTWNDISGKPTFATVATSGDYDDLINKPTLATVATSGSYNDLTDKPTIPTVNDSTVTLQVNGTTAGTFTTNQSSASTINLSVPSGYNVVQIDLPTIGPIPSTGTITQAQADLLALDNTIVIFNNVYGWDYKEYFYKIDNGLRGSGENYQCISVSGRGVSDDIITFDTTNLTWTASGNNFYPDEVSGTNDGTNWTSLTIGNDTYGIGGGSTPSNMVTTNTAQDITGEKTFVGSTRIKFEKSASGDTLGFTCYDENSKEFANMQAKTRTVGGVSEQYLTLGNYAAAADGYGHAYVGFRINPTTTSSSYYNFLAPHGTNTEFSNAGYSTSSNNYLVASVTDGTTTVKADAVGKVDISSLMPTVPTTATSTVTPTTGTFVTGTTTTTTSLVFTYTDNTTETITLVTAVTDSTSSAMTGATVTTTLS